MTKSPENDSGTRSAALLRTLVLCADAAFISLHVIYFQTGLLTNSLFSLSRDNGYAEFFQYTKFLWVIVLLAGLVSATKTAGYLAWVALFTYFLADDSLQIHERLGQVVANHLEFIPPVNVRLQDIGELIVAVIAGIAVFPFLILAFWRGSTQFRKVALDLFLFLGLLVFFGVAVDLVHEISGAEGLPDHLAFRILEEGGEMVVTSFMVWYVFLLRIHNGNIGWFLHEHLMHALPKHRA